MNHTVSFADPPFAVPPDNLPEPVTVSLSGHPVGKGRARAFVRNGHVGHYTPSVTAAYEGMVRAAAMIAMGPRKPFTQPVELTLRAVFAVPQSWPARKKAAALVGEIRPGKKPDLDNIVKAWSDALNGVVYLDDSLICRMVTEKRYGPAPLTVATVRVIP